MRPNPANPRLRAQAMGDRWRRQRGPTVRRRRASAATRNAMGNRTRPIDQHVGERIRLRRTERGLTQEQLAAALDVSYQQVQKYETGANRISAGRIYQIARKLGVEVGYFFEGARRRPEPRRAARAWRPAALGDRAGAQVRADPGPRGARRDRGPGEDDRRARAAEPPARAAAPRPQPSLRRAPRRAGRSSSTGPKASTMRQAVGSANSARSSLLCIVWPAQRPMKRPISWPPAR